MFLKNFPYLWPSMESRYGPLKNKFENPFYRPLRIWHGGWVGTVSFSFFSKGYIIKKSFQPFLILWSAMLYTHAIETNLQKKEKAFNRAIQDPWLQSPCKNKFKIPCIESNLNILSKDVICTSSLTPRSSFNHVSSSCCIKKIRRVRKCLKICRNY